jgi:hypothetical protein
MLLQMTSVSLQPVPSLLTNDVIIWDVLIAIISRNILRKFLGWQSLIRHASRIIYQDLSGNKFATVFLAISRISAGVRTYMKDYLPYSCFLAEFG